MGLGEVVQEKAIYHTDSGNGRGGEGKEGGGMGMGEVAS